MLSIQKHQYECHNIIVYCRKQTMQNPCVCVCVCVWGGGGGGGMKSYAFWSKLLMKFSLYICVYNHNSNSVNTFQCRDSIISRNLYIDLTAIRTYFTRWLIRTNSYDLTRTDSYDFC